MTENHLFIVETVVHPLIANWPSDMHINSRAYVLLGERRGGISYWMYVTMNCNNSKNKDFHCICCAFLSVLCYCIIGYMLVIHGMNKKTRFIGGMELASLRCNRDLTWASSYGLGWYKYAKEAHFSIMRLTNPSHYSPIFTSILQYRLTLT